MNNLRKRLTRTLHHKRLGESVAAIAGLAGAISVVVGILAARAAPRGLFRITTALHISRQPHILRVAAVVTGIAVAVGTAAGLLKFYTWWVERDKEEPTDQGRAD
jgi:hypothetical protein